jgi:hypothetical protein
MPSRDEQCARTLASGFPPGTYTGEASQRITGGDGSKVFEWKSLTLTVDDKGCASWRGLEHGEIAMPGDDARNLETIPSTCIYEGDAMVEASSGRFKLAATVAATASGGTPTKYHLWQCGSLKVKTDLTVELGPGCRVVGSASDARADRGSEYLCQASRPFDELKDRQIKLQKDGSVRLPITIANLGTLILHRIDRAP